MATMISFLVAFAVIAVPCAVMVAAALYFHQARKRRRMIEMNPDRSDWLDF